MRRGVRWYLVGSLVLVTLAGCGRMWIAQRAAWRHEAEVACLKSGAVKEGAGVVRIEAIEGPGICGADFPLKVAALGGSHALSYNDALRPPASIPNVPATAASPPWPIARQHPAPPAPIGAPVEPIDPPSPQPGYTPRTGSRFDGPPPPYHDVSATPGAPLSLTPPGLPQPGGAMAVAPPDDRSANPRELPRHASPPPALGPARAPRHNGAIVAAAVEPPAKLACPLVSALDQWIAGAVQPAALRWFGQPVVAIKQISAYSCRGMNGNPHARISEHAFGNALDIAAFTLADGRKITVREGWRGSPQEQGFLRDVQGAACEQFATVLAPGSNRFHYDHFHVDLMRRASGRRVCNPDAVSGEVVAARVRARLAGRRFDPAVTGSTRRSASKGRAVPAAAAEDSIDDHALLAPYRGRLPPTNPGADRRTPLPHE